MVSIKEVAKEAGVAISTVSKVLNNYPNVSEKTRQKVMDVVNRTGFVPNQLAASLSSKSMGRVALLIRLNTKTQAIDEIDMQYIAGAVNKAREIGLDVVTLFFSMIEDMSLEEMNVYFRSQSIKGLIIYGMTGRDRTLRSLIRSGEYRTVVIDSPDYSESSSSVGIDHEAAQFDVIKKTARDNKSRSMLYIAGSRDSYASQQQLSAVARAAKELKMKVLIRNGNLSELAARNIALKYARGKDMVACGSDLMAIGAMKALIDMDIFRPVCGFDGIVLMGYVGKQMNTVKQDFAQISSAAVEEMQSLLAGNPGRRIVIPHKLVRIKYEDIIR
ncbi:LacI family DNA-binding transcriptional regulator [Butyrivibrio sp. MC2013]|uniref:LacI family DNA-binding transcriptional regulator n=1 Tax=Butyrivibrio sp. MC2013 TaxID=1280686 RepID=UPI00042738C7|nr:LacI family DNA-binding transcriptional regulator [Butyrivibrio sp. MC2013]